jgi:hypothetical protein
MRSDGTSVVRIVLSKDTAVARRPPTAKTRQPSRRIELTLKDVNVGVKNNTNPLVTEHFPTPLRRVALKRDGSGALLVLELREDASVQQSTKAGPGGTLVVEVTLPKPTKNYPVPSTRKGSGAPFAPDPGTRHVEPTSPDETLDGPPGPRP